MSASISRSSGLSSSVNQAFTYTDPSNRLSAAAETGNWTQSYCYDAQGNRGVNLSSSFAPRPDWTPNWTSSCASGGSPFASANNQWIRGSGDVYDSSGNQTSIA